jgi:hypothetical protein
MRDESAVNCLLEKREELQRESAGLREQMAIVSNSIEAIDHELETFGFEGELDGKTPRAARVILFLFYLAFLSRRASRIFLGRA